MEAEINIEESRAILSALKFLVFSTSFLRSSIVSYSYSRLSPTGFILCAEVDSSKRYGVPIFGPWITGSLLRREEIRSTDHSAAPLPPPSFFLSLCLSAPIDRDITARKRESSLSFLFGGLSHDFAPPRGYEIRLRPRPRSEIPLIRLRPIAICFSARFLRVRFFRLKKKTRWMKLMLVTRTHLRSSKIAVAS